MHCGDEDQRSCSCCFPPMPCAPAAGIGKRPRWHDCLFLSITHEEMRTRNKGDVEGTASWQKNEEGSEQRREETKPRIVAVQEGQGWTRKGLLNWKRRVTA